MDSLVAEGVCGGHVEVLSIAAYRKVDEGRICGEYKRGEERVENRGERNGEKGRKEGRK